MLIRNALARNPDGVTANPLGLPDSKDNSGHPASWEGQWAGLEAGLEAGYQWAVLPADAENQVGYDDISDGSGHHAEWHSESHESSERGLANRVVSKEQRRSLSELRQSGAGKRLVWTVPELKPERVRGRVRESGRLAFGRPQSVLASRPVSRDPRLTNGVSSLTLAKPRPLSYSSGLPPAPLPILKENSVVEKRNRDVAGYPRSVRPFTALGTYEPDNDAHSATATSPLQRPHSVSVIHQPSQAFHSKRYSTDGVKTNGPSSVSSNSTNPAAKRASKIPRAQTAGPCFRCASAQAERDWLRSPGTAFDQPLTTATNRPSTGLDSRKDNANSQEPMRSRTACEHREGTKGTGVLFDRRAQTSVGRHRSVGAEGTRLEQGDISDDVMSDEHVPRSEAVSGLFRSCLALEGRLRSLELLSGGGKAGTSIPGGNLGSNTLDRRRGFEVLGRRPRTAFGEAELKPNGASGSAVRRPATSIGAPMQGSGIIGGPFARYQSKESYSGSYSHSRSVEFTSYSTDNPPAGTSEGVTGFLNQTQVRRTVHRISDLAAEMGGILQGYSDETRRLAAVTITRFVRGFLCRQRYREGRKALRDWRAEEFGPVRSLLTSWLRKRAGQEVRMKVMQAVRGRRAVEAGFRAWTQAVSRRFNFVAYTFRSKR